MPNIKNHRQVAKILRIIAVLGVIIAAVYKFFSVSEIKPNQEYSIYALILVGFGTFISLAILGRSSVRILKNPDLLVPLGLYITAQSLFDVFVQSSPFISFKNSGFNFSDVNFSVVPAIILNFAIAACFTGWITRTLLNFVETGEVDLIKSFQNISEWFPRTLGTLFLGSLPIFLFSFAFIPFLFKTSPAVHMALIYPLVLFIAIFSIILNLATAVLVPHVLATQANLREAIFEGIKISWLNKRKTFVPVVLLMLVSGWIVFISVRFNDLNTEKKKFGEYSYVNDYSVRYQTNFSTDFIWIGDYQEQSEWHKKMLKAVKQEPLGTADFRVMILMLILSLAVNLEIISRYLGKNQLDAELNNFITLNARVILIAGIFGLFFPVEYFSAKSSLNDDNSATLEEISVPRVFKDENILGKNPFFTSGRIDSEWIRNVFVGNFDGKPGTEKVVVYGDKAIVYDNQENPKSEIKFNLGRTQDSSRPSNATFHDVEVVDLDDDGLFEFIGIGSYPYTAFIVNQRGDVTFQYQGEGIDLKNVEAVDLDKDKRKEIIIADKGFIRIFNREGKEIKSVETKIKFTFDSTALTVNLNKSGDKAFLVKNFGEASLFDFTGKKIGDIKMPTNINGFLIEDDQWAHSLYFDDNKFGLFDLDGKLEAKYEAPFSEVRHSYWESKIPVPLFERNAYVFSAQAKRFKINENEDKLLAVLTSMGGKEFTGGYMLYVYDGAGTIIYQELFDESLMRLIVVPSETKIGTEDLIIFGNKTIWKYSLK